MKVQVVSIVGAEFSKTVLVAKDEKRRQAATLQGLRPASITCRPTGRLNLFGSAPGIWKLAVLFAGSETLRQPVNVRFCQSGKVHDGKPLDGVAK
jgi:hypothetical protein